MLEESVNSTINAITAKTINGINFLLFIANLFRLTEAVARGSQNRSLSRLNETSIVNLLFFGLPPWDVPQITAKGRMEIGNRIEKKSDKVSCRS